MISDAMAERGLTYRAVSENARRHGHTIGHSQVHGYATGSTKKYKREAIEAIAAGIGIPSPQLLEAANFPREAEPFLLPEDAVILTPAEREAVRGVVRTMIETRRQVMGNADSTAPMNEPDDKVAPLRPEDRPATRKHTPPWEQGIAAMEPIEGEEIGETHTDSP